MKEIRGKKSRDIYYYDGEKMTVSDKEGNTFKLYEDLSGISDNNLRIYLDWLFHDFYKITNDFKDNCKRSKIDKIEWRELK